MIIFDKYLALSLGEIVEKVQRTGNAMISEHDGIVERGNLPEGVGKPLGETFCPDGGDHFSRRLKPTCHSTLFPPYHILSIQNVIYTTYR